MQNTQYNNFTNDIYKSQDYKGKQPKVETEEQDHANLHFSGCYDDYCTIHKSEKMEQTGTHTNNKAEEEDDNKDTGIRVGENATETIAKITIHGKERTVSFREEKAHGRSIRKLKD